MKIISFMTPAIFCGVVSFVALLGVVKSGSKALILFYASLPACFIVLGGLLYQLSREIARLRRRLARMEQKLERGRGGENRPPTAADREEDEED